jgi:uncharacterized protein (TIGR02231 family)
MAVISKVTRVVVYPNQAKITREVDLSLKPGNQHFIVDDLPPGLVTESIRVRIDSEAQVRLSAMDLERVHLQETPVEKINALQKNIENLQDEMTLLQQQKETLTARIAHLDGLLKSPRSYAYGLASGKIDFENHTSWLESLSSQRDGLLEDHLEMEQDLRQKQKALKQAQASLADLAATRKKTLWQFHCDIHAAQETEARLEMEYITPDAGWQPLYDFRLGQENLHVTFQADILQTTGEDWRDVMMHLSTAQPDRQANLIDLSPWYINLRPERPFRSAAHESAAKAVIFDAAAAETGAAPSRAVFEPAVVTDQGTYVSYRVQQPISITSDAHPHKVHVAGFDLPVEQDYQAAPRYQTDVVRRIKAKNTSEFVLLPGEVQLFDGNMFIGVVAIELIPKGKTIEMPFGFDPRIEVKWELIEREVEKQFLQDRRRIRYTYRAILTSHIPHAIQIQVHDHLPVARTEAVNIKIRDLNPEPDQEDELHRLIWHLDLEPEVKKILQVGFSVDYPRDRDLQGIA